MKLLRLQSDPKKAFLRSWRAFLLRESAAVADFASPVSVLIRSASARGHKHDCRATACEAYHPAQSLTKGVFLCCPLYAVPFKQQITIRERTSTRRLLESNQASRCESTGSIASYGQQLPFEALSRRDRRGGISPEPGQSS